MLFLFYGIFFHTVNSFNYSQSLKTSFPTFPSDSDKIHIKNVLISHKSPEISNSEPPCQLHSMRSQKNELRYLDHSLSCHITTNTYFSFAPSKMAASNNVHVKRNLVEVHGKKGNDLHCLRTSFRSWVSVCLPLTSCWQELGNMTSCICSVNSNWILSAHMKSQFETIGFRNRLWRMIEPKLWNVGLVRLWRLKS